MVKYKNWIGLAVMLICASCASSERALQELQLVHREAMVSESSSKGEPSPEKGAESPFLEYSTQVGEETVDEPVEFCLDRITILADEGSGSAREKAHAFATLALVARHSPARVVRASALRAMTRLCPLEWGSLPEGGTPWATEEFETRRAKLNSYFEQGEGRSRLDQEAYLFLIQYFVDLRFDKARHAWKTLDEVIYAVGIREQSSEAQAAFERAAASLIADTCFLTALEALMDPAEVVRKEALSALFRFPWSRLRPALETPLERNYHLQSPLHCIQIEKAFKERIDKPEELGLPGLKYVINSFKFTHPGMIYHALELLEKITGIESRDPVFWVDWWSDYLLQHAGESEHSLAPGA